VASRPAAMPAGLTLLPGGASGYHPDLFFWAGGGEAEDLFVDRLAKSCCEVAAVGGVGFGLAADANQCAVGVRIF